MVDGGAAVKRCSKCQEEKPFSAFGKYKKGVNGLAYHCKQCRVPAQAAGYARKVGKTGGREKYNANAIMYRARAHAKNPMRERARKMFYHARERATRWNLAFSITFDDVLSVCGKYCPVLGVEMDWTTKVRKESSPTLDRLENDRGYVVGNVMVVSWRANRLKSDGTADELQRIVDVMTGKIPLKVHQ